MKSPLVTPLSAAEIHSKHLPYGIPEGTPDSNDLIFRSCYALSSNDETKFADWVAYRLTLTETAGEVSLNRNFRSDTLLDEDETLESKDYKGAFEAFDYHKGHLAPLGSFKGSQYASEVNLLSNIVPQKANLNAGPWMHLEEAVRKLVIKYRKVWVITGPIYESDEDELPRSDEDHKVPSSFYKVIVLRDGGETKVAAFVMEQGISRSEKYENRLTTIKDVQTKTGLTLLPSIDDGLLDELDEDWVKEWRDLE